MIDVNSLPDDTKMTQVMGTIGRDAGKTFFVVEIDPVTFSGFVLRLVAALRVESYEELLEELRPAADGKPTAPPLDAIMRILQGCDPKAVHGLIHEVLDYVLITPDPRHPGVKRVLMANEIREIKTLGEILKAAVALNFGMGG